MENAVVRLEGVSKVYLRGEGEVAALAEVDLTVGEGEFLVLSGPSGCGKSTLLHIMGAMDAPSAGRVFLRGRELSGLDDAALSRIRREEVGFIYQFFNLLPTMTARENVALPLILQKRDRGEVRRLADAALARLGLEGRAGHLPRELSGGEMQRVAIARAVVSRPSLILADEPTGNLDSRLGGEVVETLSELCREEGFTVVLATHAPELLARATRSVRMLDGRLLDGAA
ncbi:MAG: ABC transporter ATP-binding protein [bacterium]